MFRSQKDVGNKPRIGWFTLWKSNVSGYPRPAPRPPRSPLSDGPRRRSLASLPLSDMSQIVAAKLVAAKLRRCFLLNFFVCLQLHSKTGNCRDDSMCFLHCEEFIWIWRHRWTTKNSFSICLGVAWVSAAPSPSYFPHRNLRSAPKISEKPGLSHAWMCIQAMASFA